jgi:arylsulfatase A-like enzyme
MRPYNLLILCPDQLRADYLGCYGHKTIGTRHIDRLAAAGVRFDKAYCNAPLCGPSRISFATSTYVGEHGHRNYASTVSPDVPNLVTALKAAGYRTGMFGKNHLFTYRRLPEVWDELDEICLGNYDRHPEYRRSFDAFTLEPDHPYNITGRLTDETIDFLARSGQGDQPFLAWVNYQDPHPAFCCPPPYDTLFDPDAVELPDAWANYDAEKQPVRNAAWRAHSQMDECGETDIRRAIATYMGQIRYIDDSVGRLLETLGRQNLAQNTLVLFFSDHGELLGDYGMTHKLPAFYDCLTRIPVILRHPDGPGAMVRQGDWKLSVYHDDRPELYNLADDPHELANRFDDPDCREVQARLMLLLAQRLLAVKVRDVGLEWPKNRYGRDVRFEPLEG